jgi:hypothetical protein
MFNGDYDNNFPISPTLQPVFVNFPIAIFGILIEHSEHPANTSQDIFL